MTLLLVKCWWVTTLLSGFVETYISVVFFTIFINLKVNKFSVKITRAMHIFQLIASKAPGGDVPISAKVFSF